MDTERSGPRRERSEERYRPDSPVREPILGAFDDSEEYDKDRSRELSKHRSKDKKKSRREDKDHRSRDKDRSKTKDEIKERETEKDSDKGKNSTKEKRKEDREEHEKDRTKDKGREKDHDRDKHRGKDHDRDRDEKDRGRKRDRERERDNEPESNRGREKDRGKEKIKDKEERDKEKSKDRDKVKDREREKEKERTRDRERERDHEKSKDRELLDREQVKDNSRDREREVDHEKERSRDNEKVGRSREDQDHSKDVLRDGKAKKDGDGNRERGTLELGNMSSDEGAGLIKQGNYNEDSTMEPNQSTMEVAERILRMKEERLKKKSEGSETLSWVSRSRKLEEKRNLEKEKALRKSKIFEEQDNLDEDGNEFETADSLAGVKVLHGIDKVLEGGAVVLTLKDQDILANGDLNEDVDMLENVEIGEQKRRSEAYKSAKKVTGTYDDKFNDLDGEEKKMLPQYDDPAEDEGMVLDAAGRFTGEAEKKLEELRKRLQGPSMANQAEDLNSSVRISSDYFTPEEMLQFKKPKKKKALRKKEKLDLDALEMEARSVGLGASDLGSRKDSKRQAAKEEEERSEVERRKTAFQTAFAKADEASRALRMEQAVTFTEEENDDVVFADDAEDLQKSLERARKLALKKQNDKVLSGPEAIARLASSAINNQSTDAPISTDEDASDNKVVFTEMEEFVWGLQLDEETQRPNHKDVFMEEDEEPKASDEKKDEIGSWTEVFESGKDEQIKSEDKEDVVPDETLHEVPVGKGLSGVLKLLKDRGTLKETIEWGGRNMDKKKSKLVGIVDEDAPKEILVDKKTGKPPKEIHVDKKTGKPVDEAPALPEIHLERLDEFGRVLTPKQAFRILSHKFHGKGPGKMKQEKRMKQYHDELKLKQKTSTDALPQSVEKMMEAQAQLKTPYLVLSGNVKPGQTSDPRSGFATVEKEMPGSLTPMLGDKKVEHFLGIKRKAEHASGIPKKPKT